MMVIKAEPNKIDHQTKTNRFLPFFEVEIILKEDLIQDLLSRQFHR